MKQAFKSPASSIRNNRLIDLAHGPPASSCSRPEGLNVITARRALFLFFFFLDLTVFWKFMPCQCRPFLPTNVSAAKAVNQNSTLWPFVFIMCPCPFRLPRPSQPSSGLRLGSRIASKHFEKGRLIARHFSLRGGWRGEAVPAIKHS